MTIFKTKVPIFFFGDHFQGYQKRQWSFSHHVARPAHFGNLYSKQIITDIY